MGAVRRERALSNMRLIVGQHSEFEDVVALPGGASCCDRACFRGRPELSHRQPNQNQPKPTETNRHLPATGSEHSCSSHGGVFQASIWWLLPSALLGTASWSLITPIKPELYQQFFSGNGGTAAAVSGWGDSIGYALGFVSAGVVGKISDVWGRKPVLAVQKLSSLLAFATLGFRANLGNNLWWFVVGQCIMRATGPPTIYNSYLADIYPPEQRSLFFGYLWGVQTIAVAGGPMLSVYVPSLQGQQHWDLCFKLATAFAAFDFLWCIALLPESLTDRHKLKDFKWRDLNPLAPLPYLMRNRLVLTLAFVLIPTTLSGSGMIDYLFFYLQTFLGYNQMDNAWQCSLWGLAGIVINCLLLKPLLAHCGNRPLIMASLASQIGSQLMYILSKDKLVVMGIQNIVSAFNMMLGVCCSGLVSAYTPATEQGFALGTLSAVTSIVSILGPAMFGSLYSYAKGPPLNFPQLPFVIAGGLTAISMIVAALPLKRVLSKLGKIEAIYAVREGRHAQSNNKEAQKGAKDQLVDVVAVVVGIVFLGMLVVLPHWVGIY